MFITLEGIDGSGKGTQSRLLNKWVKEQGFDTFLTREPTSGEIGLLLRKGLKTGELDSRTEALLFAADRAEHCLVIRDRLDADKVVISERYLHSSLAYQGASGLDLGWIRTINSFALEPDLVLVLDIRPEEALERITSQNSLRSSLREREYFERRDFLARVREVYLDMAKGEDVIQVIDASGPLEEVQTQIRRKAGRVLKKWGSRKSRPRQVGLNGYL
jgi:dTMP kinase